MGARWDRLSRWPREDRPRFRAFCVGAAKTGTTSLHGLFSSQYRSAHEADLGRLTRALYLRLSGDGEGALRRYLLERDAKLGLEMDSASQLGLAVDLIVELLPAAKFVLTVRHPFDWLRSEVNEHLTGTERLIKPYPWRDVRFGPRGQSTLAVSRRIEQAGGYSIESYLRHYLRHYHHCLRHIPPERLLVVRTEDISTSGRLLENFFGLEADTLDASRSRANVTLVRSPLVDELDTAGVRRMVGEQCGDLWMCLSDRAAAPD